MAKFSWERAYKKKGLMIFSPGSVAILKGIQRKYSSDYIPFLDELAKNLELKDYSGRVIALRETCQLVVQDIGAVLGARGRPATQGHIERLYKNIGEVQEELAFFKTLTERNAIFAQKLASIQALTDISLEEFKGTHQLVEQQIKGIKPPKEGLEAYAGGVAPELTETLKGIGTGLLTAVTGPFAGIAQAAIGGITGVAKDIRAKKVRARERGLAEKLLPQAQYGPEELFKAYREQAITGRGPIAKHLFEKEIGPRVSPIRFGEVAEPRIREAVRGRPSVERFVEARGRAPIERVVEARGEVPKRERPVLEPAIGAPTAKREAPLEAARGVLKGGVPIERVVEARGEALKRERPVIEPIVGASTVRREAILGAVREEVPLKGKALRNAAMPMYFFFDKLAYKAKWTKAVRTLLVKIARGGVTGLGVEGKGSPSVVLLGGLKALTKALSLLPPVLATVAVAAIAAKGFDMLLKEMATATSSIREWFKKKKGEKLTSEEEFFGKAGMIVGGKGRGALEPDVTPMEAMKKVGVGGLKGFGLGYSGAVAPGFAPPLMERAVGGPAGMVAGAVTTTMPALGPAASAMATALTLMVGHLFGGKLLAQKGEKVWEGLFDSVGSVSERMKEVGEQAISWLGFKKREEEIPQVKVITEVVEERKATVSEAMTTEMTTAGQDIVESIRVLAEGAVREMGKVVEVIRKLVPAGAPMTPVRGDSRDIGDTEVSALNEGLLGTRE